MNERTLLSIEELAKRWGVSVPTIRRMKNEGKIKPVKGFGDVKFNI